MPYLASPEMWMPCASTTEDKKNTECHLCSHKCPCEHTIRRVYGGEPKLFIFKMMMITETNLFCSLPYTTCNSLIMNAK